MFDLPTNERPLPLRRRVDITSTPREGAHGRDWICKDPVRRRYYALSEVEHSLWRMLDGATSLQQLKQRFAQNFKPRRLETSTIVAFLARLYRQELIIALAPGQGVQLAERRRSRRWQEFVTLPVKLLGWRLRGIDPDAYLNRLLPYAQWLFRPTMIWLALGLVSLAGAIAFLRYPQLNAELPGAAEFFQFNNLLLLGTILSAVKVLHELGHAFACKYFGGEVRELGVMFLFFAPCLYCDVSDAWMFRKRRQRIAVSLAGILVEICLAACAVLVWSLTQPGVLHSLSLNVMVVCGISTLIINGNPLMRYDGYYVLADALDLPNLDERAKAKLRRILAALFLGVALPRETPDRERKSGFVLAYALLSTIYRWVLLASVLGILYAALRPQRLELLALIASALCIAGIVAMPIHEAVQQVRNPFFWQRLSLRQVAVRFSAAALLLAALCFTPLPCRVTGPGVLESALTQSLYATTPGFIASAVTPGTEVKAGEMVLRLDNPSLRLELARLRTEVERLSVRVRTLEALRGVDSDAAAQIPAAQEQLQDLRRQVAQHQLELDRLTHVALQRGRVIEPPHAPLLQDLSQTLPQWQASPLATFNHGARIETGTLLAQVVDPSQLEVRLLLDPSSISLVEEGQSAYISPWQAPGDLIRGTVVEVSRLPVEEVPAVLQASGEVPMHRMPDGHDNPVQNQYQVRIRVDDPLPDPVFGGRCTARLIVKPQSVATRLVRYLRQNFGRS